MPTLRLTLTDYRDPAHWRWVLADHQGSFLAAHPVSLDTACGEYGGFLDLSGYLDYHHEAFLPEQQLAALGAWVGERVFGGDHQWRGEKGFPFMERWLRG